ncbi:S-adenosyl-L-methionine-dependent methyltransferase [Phanerochaete sordida]|uniref:S-adenosyl-L-methionine-dependent methyltransferase n=1 Tax=Phanerochaete sordida TaxID=48140 RepID=A0A9P3LKG0_9APHY|nr:S-adenosyl-L-methionine-dependent methyltransferase [Phanerochaete sordida]
MSKESLPYIVGQGDAVLKLFGQRTVDNSAAYLKDSLEPHMTILDVGCGPGSITIDLARRVPQGRVTGVDTESARPTLDKARAQAEREGVKNVDFRVGDALALPFADASFDVVHAHQVLIHVTDPLRMLAEMRRVAKPGGLVACRTWDDGTLMMVPPSEGVGRARAITQRVMDFSGRNFEAGRYTPRWAREVGFKPANIKVTTSNYTSYTPAERYYFASMMTNVLKESPMKTVALEKGLATEEDFERGIAAWEEWTTNEDGLSVGVNVEILCRV